LSTGLGLGFNEGAGVTFFSSFNPAGDGVADDYDKLVDALRQSDGGSLILEPGAKIYGVTRRPLLKDLCPLGVTIVMNGATIKALPGFSQAALLSMTNTLSEEPLPYLKIVNGTLDAAGLVTTGLFGAARHAEVTRFKVTGATDYQVNARWYDSTLDQWEIEGNAAQVNNGFDCMVVDSTLSGFDVDMSGNATESGFWLNTSSNSVLTNIKVTDGYTGIGCEKCENLTFHSPVIQGDRNFRAFNVLNGSGQSRQIAINQPNIDAGAQIPINFTGVAGAEVNGGALIGTGVAAIQFSAGTESNIRLRGIDFTGHSAVDKLNAPNSGPDGLTVRGCAGLADQG